MSRPLASAMPAIVTAASEAEIRSDESEPRDEQERRRAAPTPIDEIGDEGVRELPSGHLPQVRQPLVVQSVGSAPRR